MSLPSPTSIPVGSPLTQAQPQSGQALWQGGPLTLFVGGIFNSSDSLILEVNPSGGQNGFWIPFGEPFTGPGVQIFQYLGTCYIRWLFTTTNTNSAVRASIS